MRTTPAAAATGGLAALSPDGQTLALAALDGRLKTFDTASGKLKRAFVGDTCLGDDSSAPSTSGNGHLAEEFTCVVWGHCSPKGKGKKKSAPASSLVAVGTRAGDVVAYDFAMGELKWKARGCNEGGVLALAFGQAGVFYSVGEDAQVCAINAATGAVETRFQAGRAALSGAAVCPDQERLLIGSSTLALWELDSEKCVGKFTGHLTRVQSVAVSPDGCWGVSCASGERNAVLWRLEECSKKKESSAAGLLNTEEPLAHVSTSSAGEEEGVFHVVAVSALGAVYVWRCTPSTSKSGKRRVEGSLLARVGVEGVSKHGSSGEGVFAARLEAGNKDASLLVARGSTVKPTFEVVRLADETSILLKATESGILLPGGKGATKGGGSSGPAHAQNVIGNDSLLGGGVVMRPAVADNAAAVKRKRSKEEVAAAMEVDDVDTVVPESGELTLGQRVAALELEQDQAVVDEDKVTAVPEGPIKADSLGVLLLQAIRSEDAALLERCLNVSNDNVIKNTVARLPPTAALSFVNAVVARLQTRPARGAQMARWLRAALVAHTAHLVSSPAAAPALMSLYQTLETRITMYRPMLSLAGRLQLLMAQLAAGGKEEGEGVPADALRAGPAATYDLSDDDDDEDGRVAVEDPFLARTDGSDDDDSDDEEGDSDEEEAGWETDDEEEEDD